MYQVLHLHSKYDELQNVYGDSLLMPVYGAGCVRKPLIMFVFMNPTAKNVSSYKTWNGIRAPWLGTKQVWEMFCELGLLNKKTYEEIKTTKSIEWTEKLAEELYREVEENKIFITNLAKCTQADARPLSDKVFNAYRDIMLDEIQHINPQNIITFGNQVSSILLSKKISVSDYDNDKCELLRVGDTSYKVYPAFYPVGQGRRNMPKTIDRIKTILKR